MGETQSSSGKIVNSSHPNFTVIIITAFILLSQSLIPVPKLSMLIDEEPFYTDTTSNCSILGLELNTTFSFESYGSAEYFMLGPDNHDFTLMTTYENLSTSLWKTDGYDMTLLAPDIIILPDGYRNSTYLGTNNASQYSDFNGTTIHNAFSGRVYVVGTLGNLVFFTIPSLLNTTDQFFTVMELWKTDGTPEGTTMVYSDEGILHDGSRNSSRTAGGWFNRGNYDDTKGAMSMEFGNYLYFGAHYWSTPRLWRTDGTAIGTESVNMSTASMAPTNFISTSQGLVFFVGFNDAWLVNNSFTPIQISLPTLWPPSQTNFRKVADRDIIEMGSNFYTFTDVGWSDGTVLMTRSSTIFDLENEGWGSSVQVLDNGYIFFDNQLYVLEKKCYSHIGDSVSCSTSGWPGQGEQRYNATYSIELWRYGVQGGEGIMQREYVSNISQYIESPSGPSWFESGYGNEFAFNLYSDPAQNTLFVGWATPHGNSHQRYFFYADGDDLNGTTSSPDEDTSHLWAHFGIPSQGQLVTNADQRVHRTPILMPSNWYTTVTVLDKTFSSDSNSEYYYGSSVEGHSVVVGGRILLFAYGWNSWYDESDNTWISQGDPGVLRNFTGEVYALLLDKWDFDQDGVCNYEDQDDDNDGWSDYDDDFPQNPDEYSDTDWDGIGDNEDTDDDGDGYNDSVDAFPLISWEWIDTDDDGTGDNSDRDDDDDGWEDYTENQCDTDPLDANSIPLDTDGDMTCNKFDDDDDGDGFNDTSDIFPLDSTEWEDNDEDGIGDNSDDDDDDDGTPDSLDAFPLDSTEQSDTDGDGIGDNSDTDDDGDHIEDVDDFCPRGDTGWISGAALGTDYDGDGCRDDGEDIDDDGDGVEDTDDGCPRGHTGWLSNPVNDIDGDGCHETEDYDNDGDGFSDTEDSFPEDPEEWNDSDGDGVGDNSDAYPDDSSRWELNDKDEGVVDDKSTNAILIGAILVLMTTVVIIVLRRK